LSTVNGDDAHGGRQQVAVGVAAGADGHEDDARHPLGAQDLEVGTLACRVLVGVREQQRVAGRPQHGVDAAHHLGEERVLQVRDDDADGLAGAGAKGLGGATGAIAEGAGRFEDPEPQPVADGLGVGKSARDGGDGDAGAVGHPPDGRGSAARGLPRCAGRGAGPGHGTRLVGGGIWIEAARPA
jgi:hypothetical protein